MKPDREGLVSDTADFPEIYAVSPLHSVWPEFTTGGLRLPQNRPTPIRAWYDQDLQSAFKYLAKLKREAGSGRSFRESAVLKKLRDTRTSLCDYAREVGKGQKVLRKVDDIISDPFGERTSFCIDAVDWSGTQTWTESSEHWCDSKNLSLDYDSLRNNKIKKLLCPVKFETIDEYARRLQAKCTKRYGDSIIAVTTLKKHMFKASREESRNQVLDQYLDSLQVKNQFRDSLQLKNQGIAWPFASGRAIDKVAQLMNIFDDDRIRPLLEKPVYLHFGHYNEHLHAFEYQILAPKTELLAANNHSLRIFDFFMLDTKKIAEAELPRREEIVEGYQQFLESATALYERV